MANKRYSITIIRKMQTKTTMIYYCTSTRRAKVLKTDKHQACELTGISFLLIVTTTLGKCSTVPNTKVLSFTYLTNQQFHP